jgi:hypothetical protein
MLKKQKREAIVSLMAAVRSLQRAKAFSDVPHIKVKIDGYIEQIKELQRELERIST